MMIDTNQLPNSTKMIFDTLRGGNFIIDNHPEPLQRKMFRDCANHLPTLKAYFEPLGYDLEEGDGYFLFYIQDLSEAAKEHRMRQLLHILDVVTLMVGVFANFNVGWRGSPAELEITLKGDILRREELERMRGIKGKTLTERCVSLFDSLYKFGCLVPLDDKLNNYLLSSAYNYLSEFYESVQRINYQQDEVES